MKFEFSIEEVNIILAALGKAPYEHVYQLVNSIQQQAQQQAQQDTDS